MGHMTAVRTGGDDRPDGAGDLGQQRLALDAMRFTGRERLMGIVDAALAGEGPSVLWIHGHGGMGKSAVLREVVRRAATADRPVWSLDGRTLETDVAALEEHLDGVFEASDPVVVVDTFESVDVLDTALRERIVSRLGRGALVVVASRRPPDAAWLADGWEHLVRVVELGPFTPEEARALLAYHGITGGDDVARVFAWSGGSPLAIGIAAVTGTEGPLVDVDSPDLRSLILERLAGSELADVDRAVIEVAAVAYAVDGRLLADVLAGRRTSDGYKALRRLTVAEHLGSRVTLHDMVRRVLREELAERAPDRHRELVVRIADALRVRAATSEPDLIVDLAELIDDPDLRWGMVGDRSRYVVDRVREGDAQEAARLLGAGTQQWWQGVLRYVEEAPDTVLVARDRSGRPAGLTVAVTPASAPAWVEEDPVLGPWVADARRRAPDGDVLLWRDELDLETARDPHAASTVTATLNAAAVRRCGLRNVRWFYGTLDPTDDAHVRLAEAMGAEHLGDLDVVDGERHRLCYLLDHGPGGFVDAVHSMVCAAVGATPSAAASPVHHDDVEAALRSFGDAAALAASPLARGDDPGERAEFVRSVLRAALDAAFEDHEPDRILRACLELGYLTPGTNHAAAAAELHLSRATYFRRLREARERLALVIDVEVEVVSD